MFDGNRQIAVTLIQIFLLLPSSNPGSTVAHSIVCIMTDISLRLYQLSETQIMQSHATVNTNCKRKIMNTIVSFSGLLCGRLRAEHLDHSLWRVGKNELVVPQGKMEAFAVHRCYLHPSTNNIQWVGDKLACKPIR